MGGALTVSGATALNGNTVVGDAVTDTVTVTATILGALTFEGSTVDGFETILAVGNPDADKTLTLPTETGTLLTEISAVSTAITGVGTLGALTVSGATALNGNTVVGDAVTDTVTVTATILGALTFEGSTDDGFETILAVGNPGADKTL